MFILHGDFFKTMKRLIHYTTKWSWDLIQESGFLLPKSDPQEAPIPFPEGMDLLLSADSYLVGLPESSCQRWVESGLMEYLLMHTGGEVILEVPILEPEKCFVRDHAPCSPKGFMERYGEDLWKELFQRRIDFTDSRIADAVRQYYTSTIALRAYKGDYRVPEIWVHQETPIDKLRVIKAPHPTGESLSSKYSL